MVVSTTNVSPPMAAGIAQPGSERGRQMRTPIERMTVRRESHFIGRATAVGRLDDRLIEVVTPSESRRSNFLQRTPSELSCKLSGACVHLILVYDLGCLGHFSPLVAFSSAAVRSRGSMMSDCSIVQSLHTSQAECSRPCPPSRTPFTGSWHCAPSCACRFFNLLRPHTVSK